VRPPTESATAASVYRAGCSTATNRGTPAPDLTQLGVWKAQAAYGESRMGGFEGAGGWQQPPATRLAGTKKSSKKVLWPQKTQLATKTLQINELTFPNG